MKYEQPGEEWPLPPVGFVWEIIYSNDTYFLVLKNEFTTTWAATKMLKKPDILNDETMKIKITDLLEEYTAANSVTTRMGELNTMFKTQRNLR